MRNPSTSTTSDKVHILPSAAVALKCFCVFVSPFSIALSALFLAAAAVVLPRYTHTLLSLLPFTQPPQNHLFFSNQVQHLEEEEVPKTAFVLYVRTYFRQAEVQPRASYNDSS